MRKSDHGEYIALIIQAIWRPSNKTDVSMDSRYNTLEKDHVRNSWVKAVEKILENKKEVRILEMAGYSTDVWWGDLKLLSKKKSFEVSGITMDDKFIGKEKYSRLFVGRLDKLLKKKSFLRTFPYDFVNLDYYGGGRWFDQRYRYDKTPDIYQTIKNNCVLNNSFYLALTLDINDEIYPWFKHGKDVILTSSLHEEIKNFMNSLENVDHWNLWLAIIGNSLNIYETGKKLKCCCELVYPPFTYVGESGGHKSRMISYLFNIHKTKDLCSATEHNSWELIKNTKFLKWMKESGEVIIKKGNF